jgi:predicted  nucleic acid-binding Zn-ribbon protein
MTGVKEGGTTTRNVFSGAKKDEKIKSLTEENNALHNKVKELNDKIDKLEKELEKKSDKKSEKKSNKKK